MNTKNDKQNVGATDIKCVNHTVMSFTHNTYCIASSYAVIMSLIRSLIPPPTNALRHLVKVNKNKRTKYLHKNSGEKQNQNID